MGKRAELADKWWGVTFRMTAEVLEEWQVAENADKAETNSRTGFLLTKYTVK